MTLEHDFVEEPMDAPPFSGARLDSDELPEMPDDTFFGDGVPEPEPSKECVPPDADAFAAARSAPIREVAALLGMLEQGRVKCPNCGATDTTISGAKLSCARCERTHDPIAFTRRVRRLRDDVQAVALLVKSFGIPKPEQAGCPADLKGVLDPTIRRIVRRCQGVEKPIALPWKILAPHFGGGLWAGLHIVNAGTGVGKTQFALQTAVSGTRAGVPVLYIGLELGEFDIAVRLLGEEARVPWSMLWTGAADGRHLAAIQEALPRMWDLPLHFEVSRPHGYAPSDIVTAVTAMRARYPEADGPGSRPILVIVDFLQLVGNEVNDEQEMRARVGRASYVLRDLANRLGVAVLCISSVARERYKLLAEIHTQAELSWQGDANGWPIDRRILNTDAIVGAGKESGDIEYSADSVTLIAKVPTTWSGNGCDVVVATAKGRATGAMWSPLHFTGFRYQECTDGGARMVDSWTEAAEQRERVREEKKQAKEDAKVAKIDADADAVLAYVQQNPGCSVRQARLNTVNDSARRWSAAIARLGSRLVQDKSNKTGGLWAGDAPGGKADGPGTC